ncbi:MAG: DUF1330 domain-containing protein [Alphaproteobacteria bacterium]|nr:DUF1330 domain-containing protein [Alphaproteobacteria bacterium]
MPAFLLVDVEVTDQKTYDAYRARTPALVARYGGQYRVRGGQHEVLEGEWPVHRFVVIEFPDMQALKGFYDSPEYRVLRRERFQSSRSKAIAIEGV